MIRVTVNGTPTEAEDAQTISSLLDAVDLPGPYLAVELNGDVVPKEQHSQQLIKDGDRIEVVTLVGGG